VANICAGVPFPRRGTYPHVTCVCEIHQSWERGLSSLHGDALVEGQVFKWPTHDSAPCFRVTPANAAAAAGRIFRGSGSTCFGILYCG
jgi:hypothetical protein